MERPKCRAVKLSIPPSTKRQRSNVMGMALFAREGGLNSALPACPDLLIRKSSLNQLRPSPCLQNQCQNSQSDFALTSSARAGAPTPKVRPARSFLVDSSRVTLDLYRDRSAIGISRSLQISIYLRRSPWSHSLRLSSRSQFAEDHSQARWKIALFRELRRLSHHVGFHYPF